MAETQAELAYDDIGLESSVLPDKRELPAWTVSLIVHVVVLGLLWSVRLATYGTPELEIISETTPATVKAETFSVAQETMGNETKADRPRPSQASALLPGRDPQKDLDRQLEESTLEAPQRQVEPILQPSRDEFVATVQTFGDTIDVGGTEGAIDVLVREIEAKARERKTLVVWLFDASQSLNERRADIADRFERVYKQLHERNKGIEERLETAVVSFGEKTMFLTEKPITDVSDIAKAVRRIEPDKKGKEYVFTAINDVMLKWKRELLAYRRSAKTRRNVMLIVVTDERGDDYAGRSGKQYGYLDYTIGQMRKLNIYGYCVGNAAVFGREKGYVSFKDDDGFQWVNLAVDQGPETVSPERLNIPFWGSRSRKVERLSANYGPYALTRMCTETGGRYLITHHSQGGAKFPTDVMRKYKPFYGSIPSYLKNVQSNPAKLALFNVSQHALQEPIPRPKLDFRADTDNVLRAQIQNAQRPFARLDAQLGTMIAILEQAEKSRPQIREDRWRAAYDLAMGRLLATHVRSFGYRTTLAGMSSSPLPFKKPDSNQWKLVPSSNWKTYPPSVKKIAKKAAFYLKRVIDEHPETPWALLAEHELSTEMGWAWREGKMNIARRNGNPDTDPGILLANDDPNNPNPKKKKKPLPRKKPKL